MSLGASWELKIRGAANKALAGLPAKDRKRIVEVIRALPMNPYAGDVEKMRGRENVWRRRTGTYRIFYEIIIEKKIIYVFWVERRASSTY